MRARLPSLQRRAAPVRRRLLLPRLTRLPLENHPVRERPVKRKATQLLRRSATAPGSAEAALFVDSAVQFLFADPALFLAMSLPSQSVPAPAGANRRDRMAPVSMRLAEHWQERVATPRM